VSLNLSRVLGFNDLAGIVRFSTRTEVITVGAVGKKVKRFLTYLPLTLTLVVMKTTSLLIACLLVLLLAFPIVAGNVICPIDDFVAYFTGTTRVVDGTLLYQYRCPRGHIMWSKMP
jgi:hypothetical protein